MEPPVRRRVALADASLAEGAFGERDGVVLESHRGRGLSIASAGLVGHPLFVLVEEDGVPAASATLRDRGPGELNVPRGECTVTVTDPFGRVLATTEVSDRGSPDLLFDPVGGALYRF